MNVFWPVTEGLPQFFLFFLTTIGPAHHTYNIQLKKRILMKKNCFKILHCSPYQCTEGWCNIDGTVSLIFLLPSEWTCCVTLLLLNCKNQTSQGTPCNVVELLSIKYLPCLFARFWFSKLAGCMMCLDQVQAMQSMHNSWHNRHWPTEVGKCALSEVLVPKWHYGFMPWWIYFIFSNHWRPPFTNRKF